MPKDLTKLSLKDFEMLANGDFDSRMRWNQGTLELTVAKARHRPGTDEDDEE